MNQISKQIDLFCIFWKYEINCVFYTKDSHFTNKKQTNQFLSYLAACKRKQTDRENIYTKWKFKMGNQQEFYGDYVICFVCCVSENFHIKYWCRLLWPVTILYLIASSSMDCIDNIVFHLYCWPGLRRYNWYPLQCGWNIVYKIFYTFHTGRSYQV